MNHLIKPGTLKMKDIGLGLLILLGVVCLMSIPWKTHPETPVPPAAEPQKKEEAVPKVAVTMQPVVEPKEEKKPVKSPPAVKPMQYSPGTTMVDQGRAMIGDKGQKIGSFPDIVVDYTKHLGIKGYLSAMEQLGGRFCILDQAQGRIVAQIDHKEKRVVPRRSFKGLSPRSRQVPQDPLLDRYLQQAQLRYGPGSYAVILLVPLKMDQYLIGALDDAVNQSGKSIRDYAGFYGVYSQQKDGMFLWIYEARLKSGATERFDLSIKIS